MAATEPPLRSTLLTAQGSSSAVVASRAAIPRPGFVDPLTLSKEPEMTILLASGDATTDLAPQPPSTGAVLPFSATVDALTAATLARAAPPTLVNSPTR